MARAFGLLCGAGLAFGTLSIACSSHRSPQIPSSPIDNRGCERAKLDSKRLAELLKQGKIDRTLRLARFVGKTCPSQTSSTWPYLLSALGELERWEELRELSQTIMRSGDISPETRQVLSSANGLLARCKDKPNRLDGLEVSRQAYEQAEALSLSTKEEDWRQAKKLFIESREAAKPNGLALIHAGLMANKLGEGAAAQRLFDRGIDEVQHATSSPLTVDVPLASDEYVLVIAWSSLGKVAFVRDKQISLSAVGTMKEEFRLSRHEQQVKLLTFSPNGRLLASSDDQEVRVWDTFTGRLLKKLAQNYQPNVLAFSSDSKQLAVGGRGIRLWDLATWDEIMPHWLHFDKLEAIESLAFSPDGKYFAAFPLGQCAGVWDIASGNRVALFNADIALDQTLSFSPNSALFAIGATNWGRANYHYVQLWQLSPIGRRSAQDIMVHYQAPADSPFRKLLATEKWEADYHESKWDLSTGKGDGEHEPWGSSIWRGMSRLSGIGRLNSLAFSGDTKLVSYEANTDHDARVRIWNFGPGGGLTQLEGAYPPIQTSSHSPHIIGVSPIHNLSLWNTATGIQEVVPIANLKAFSPLGLSSDGDILATLQIGVSKSVVLWDTVNWRERGRLVIGDASVHDAEFSPNGGTLVLKLSHGLSVSVWNLSSGARIGTDELVQAPSAFAPDGLLAGLNVKSDTIKLWQLSPLREVSSFDGRLEERVHDLAFSPDGKWLVATSRAQRIDGKDNRATIWDTSTRKQVAILEPHVGELHDIAFSPDGRWFAISSDRGVIGLWKTGSWTPIATLVIDEASDANFVFTPDGHMDILGRDRAAAKRWAVCRVGNVSFPFEACAERALVPGLLGKILNGNSGDWDP